MKENKILCYVCNGRGSTDTGLCYLCDGQGMIRKDYDVAFPLWAKMLIAFCLIALIAAIASSCVPKDEVIIDDVILMSAGGIECPDIAPCISTVFQNEAGQITTVQGVLYEPPYLASTEISGIKYEDCRILKDVFVNISGDIFITRTVFCF